MRLSRANIPLASEDRTHGQAKSPSPHYNLAPHFWPGFINLQHFCHSRWRNPVRLSKSGQAPSLPRRRLLRLHSHCVTTPQLDFFMQEVVSSHQAETAPLPAPFLSLLACPFSFSRRL